ncbi:hypothetical protein GC176_05375 [bacterium]|nr:hypothetical protein [bacterium]
MAQTLEHYEFDLCQGDKVLIGDLVLTVHEIASGETCLLVETTSVDADCELSSPLAQVVCD